MDNFDAYIRVSQVGDRTEEESTEVYEAQCREWALRNDARIVEVAEDTNVSGATAVRGRKLERLVQRVQSGESDGIVTPHIDRFGRDVIEGSVALKRITDAGGRLIAVRDGFDSTSPGSRLIFNVRMSFAEDFLERTRDNFDNGMKQFVERGGYPTGRLPFGYAKDEVGGLVVVEAEKVVVKELYRRRAKGTTLAALHRWVNDEKGEVVRGWRERTGRSGDMSRTGVRSVLANRVYLGEARVPDGRGKPLRVLKDRHGVIVTPNEWEAAQVRRAAFSPRNGATLNARLRGLVFCATCGKRCRVGLYGSPENRRPNYTCTSDGCSARASMRASKLDAHVEGELMQAAADHEPHVETVILGDTRYADAMLDVEGARDAYDEFANSVELQRELGMKMFTRALRVRGEALEAARLALSEIRPPESNAQEGPLTAEQVETELARWNFARFVDRVVLEPNGPGPYRSAAERAAIYFVGSDEPYVADYPHGDDPLVPRPGDRR